MRVGRLEGAPSLPPLLRRLRLFWFLVSVAVVTAIGGDGRFAAVDFGGIGGDIKPVVTAIGVDDDGDTTTGAALFSTAARWPHLS